MFSSKTKASGKERHMNIHRLRVSDPRRKSFSPHTLILRVFTSCGTDIMANVIPPDVRCGDRAGRNKFELKIMLCGEV